MQVNSVNCEKMAVILLFVGLLLNLYYVKATDYVFFINENGLGPCTGEENKFIDHYFDLSTIKCEQLDEETMILNGHTIFLQNVDPKLPVRFKLDIEKLTSGRLIKTAFSMDRENICETFFEKDSLWNDFVWDFDGDTKFCPPKNGVKYEFKNKTVPMSIAHLAPGLEGHYVVTAHLSNNQEKLCLVLEGDFVRKEIKSKNPVLH